MFAIAMFAAGEISCDGMVNSGFMAVTMLMVGVHPSPGVQRVSVLLSTHMPVRVRARQPCSQQGDTDEQSDGRS